MTTECSAFPIWFRNMYFLLHRDKGYSHFMSVPVMKAAGMKAVQCAGFAPEICCGALSFQTWSYNLQPGIFLRIWKSQPGMLLAQV